jgi:hypothetical protein
LAEPTVPEQLGTPFLRRPWTIALLGGVVALGLAVPTLPGAWSTPSFWSVVALFATFLLTESVQLELEFRRQTFAISPSELAVVVALVEIGGVWTTVARVAAVAIVLARQQLPLPKAAFNLALTVAEVCTAVLVLSWLPQLDLDDPVSWLVLVLAMLTASCVGILLTFAAISLAGGFPGWEMLLSAVPAFAVAPLSVIVGVIALLLTWETPWAWALIVPLVLGVVAIFRQSTHAVRERRTVQRVYDFARRVELVTADEAGTREIVSAVRELLNADRVALWLPPYLD